MKLDIRPQVAPCGAFIHGLHASNVEEIGEVTYPQSLANCEACHTAGTYNAARPGAIAISTGGVPSAPRSVIEVMCR